MPSILFLTENSGFRSGSGSGSGYEYDSGSGSGYEYDSGSGNDNTEIIEWFIKSSMHPAIYFILSVLVFIILTVLFCICSEESRLRKDKRNRNRSNSDNQSWDSFVAEMEGHMDVLAYAFVQSQQREENEEKIKSENLKRINVTVENENYLNINNEEDNAKYYKFPFNDNETECSICHEHLMNKEISTDMNIEDLDELYMFSCGHTIHRKCYEDYKLSVLVTNDTVFKCPVCRD